MINCKLQCDTWMTFCMGVHFLDAQVLGCGSLIWNFNSVLAYKSSTENW